jgi:hypothetical protein
MLAHQTNYFQKLKHSGFSLMSVIHTMDEEGLSYDVSHTFSRIERGKGVLEDDLHLSP